MLNLDLLFEWIWLISQRWETTDWLHRCEEKQVNFPFYGAENQAEMLHLLWMQDAEQTEWQKKAAFTAPVSGHVVLYLRLGNKY